MSWTAPKTWAYKEILSSSDLNTYVSDNITALDAGTNTGTAWADFTPSIAVSGGTAPTYTLKFVSRYKQIGKLVFVIIDWRNTSGGTAGAGTAQITFTPPVNASASTIGNIIAAGYAINSTATEYRIGVIINSSNSFGLYEATLNNFTGAEQNAAIRAVTLSFCYEAA